jgi:hypothetical protein
MRDLLPGPPLVVHILIATMLNALCFPLIYRWTGAILYAFLVSVCLLGIYGLIVMWWARGRHG